MLIAGISDECITGLDLLEPYGCEVRRLMTGDEQVSLRKPRNGAPAACCQIRLRYCVELPPQSETVVQARILIALVK